MADTRRLSTSILWGICLNKNGKDVQPSCLCLERKRATAGDSAKIPTPPGPRKKADSLPKCKGTQSESTSVSFLPMKLTARKTGENILFPTLLRNQYELEMGLYGCKLAPYFWYLGILGVSLEEVIGDSFKESCVKEITCHSKIIKTV